MIRGQQNIKQVFMYEEQVFISTVLTGGKHIELGTGPSFAHDFRLSRSVDRTKDTGRFGRSAARRRRDRRRRGVTDHQRCHQKQNCSEGEG
jgi:hypothetical protein